MCGQDSPSTLSATVANARISRECLADHPLPARREDDDGGPVTRRRQPVVTRTERAGIQIQTIRAEPMTDDVSGAMPSVRPASRVQIGNDPHPRFPSTPSEVQE